MLKIGITGNIACGKSVASDVIISEGFSVIDCDNIVKELYSEEKVIGEIKNRFPEFITDNKVDFKKLSDIIFKDKKFKSEFERFIFPKVKEKIYDFFDKCADKTSCFVIVPLLFEAGFEDLFDKIIFISSDEKLRYERLNNRGTILSNKAEEVINSQKNEEEKISQCDYVIKNNGTLEEFKLAVKKLIYEL